MASFYDIKWNSRRLEVTGEFEDKGKLNLWFEASLDWVLSDDIIASALTSLCEKKYNEIFFDLDCNKNVVDSIRRFTGAKVRCRNERNIEMISGGGNAYAINFSGGFDSLAAYCLMPQNTYLISMDFGKKFERERFFFEKFNPIIVKSNFRQYGFERHSWTFMAIGSILFSQTLNLKYDIWGTILEATWWQMVRNPVAGNNVCTQPMSGIGLLDARITNAFTEVGTAMIVTKYLPDMVNESLRSLSDGGTEKLYRKWLLTDIICRKYKRNVQLKSVDLPKKRVEWGTYLALDFLAIYELKNVSRDIVENTVYNIPDEALELVKKLNLDFYERMNTNFIGTIPQEILSIYMEKVLGANILPYTEADWAEFDLVVGMLSKYHNFKRE